MVDSTTPFQITFPCFVAEFANGKLLSMPADRSRCLVILTDVERTFRFTALVRKLGAAGVTPLEVENEAELLKCVRDAKRSGASCIIIDPQPDALPPTKFFYKEFSIDAVIKRLESQK